MEKRQFRKLQEKEKHFPCFTCFLSNLINVCKFQQQSYFFIGKNIIFFLIFQLRKCYCSKSLLSEYVYIKCFNISNLHGSKKKWQKLRKFKIRHFIRLQTCLAHITYRNAILNNEQGPKNGSHWFY